MFIVSPQHMSVLATLTIDLSFSLFFLTLSTSSWPQNIPDVLWALGHMECMCTYHHGLGLGTIPTVLAWKPIGLHALAPAQKPEYSDARRHIPQQLSRRCQSLQAHPIPEHSSDKQTITSRNLAQDLDGSNGAVVRTILSVQRWTETLQWFKEPKGLQP